MAVQEVWLIRHGETEWSKAGKHTSVTDLALTQAGEQQSAGLAKRLAQVRFAAVLTSPLTRARRTAEFAGFPDAEPDPDLTEWDYGDYEGMTTAEIRASVPGWTVWTDPCPGGESAAQLSERLDRAIARVRAIDGPVLLVGHAHESRALTARWLGLPVSEGRLFRLETASVSVLGYERENPVILRWNCP